MSGTGSFWADDSFWDDTSFWSGDSVTGQVTLWRGIMARPGRNWWSTLNWKKWSELDSTLGLEWSDLSNDGTVWTRVT